MSLKVAEPGEALVTASTGEGLEAGVRQEVGLEVAAPAEGLATVDTFVGFDSCSNAPG